MKKKIALIILLAIACTVILAACSQPDATKIIPRWSNSEDETYEYAISLADFAESGDSRFTAYSHDNSTYYKDFTIATGEGLDSSDEVRPKAIDGIYTISIKYDDTTKCNTVTTTLDINVTYEYNEGKIKIADNVWVELVSDIANSDLVVSTDTTAKTITLKSHTETMVEFAYNETQAPKQSSTKMTGFYIGKKNQEASSYEVSTKYNYEDKNAVAKITLSLNGGQPTENEYKLKRQTEGSFIDSNQLFTYLRSFDKSSTSFQDRPAVTVYNPLSQKLQTANFYFNASAKAVLTNGANQLFAKVPTISVLVDGTPFMIQVASPNMLDEKGKGSDRVQYGTSWYAKHTPLRFRSGYMAFELNYQVGTPQSAPHQNQQLWDALNSYVNAESK